MTKPIPELSYSQELADLAAWDRSFWLSRAFIEGARVLCEKMLEEEFSSQYSSSRVIVHLARQGIELFLKAALDASGRSVPRTHDLNALLASYKEHYADSAFDFTVPPRFATSLTLPLFEADDKILHGTMDQRFRFATDLAGQSFATPELFDCTQVLEEVQLLDKELKVVEWCRIRPYLDGKPFIR